MVEFLDESPLSSLLTVPPLPNRWFAATALVVLNVEPTVEFLLLELPGLTTPLWWAMLVNWAMKFSKSAVFPIPEGAPLVSLCVLFKFLLQRKLG